MKDEARQRRQQLYDHLKMSILTLRLAPGSDLDEAALSQAFGLSRTPLREVFREMAGAGYLDLRANRGARVSEMKSCIVPPWVVVKSSDCGATT